MNTLPHMFTWYYTAGDLLTGARKLTFTPMTTHEPPKEIVTPYGTHLPVTKCTVNGTLASRTIKGVAHYAFDEEQSTLYYWQRPDTFEVPIDPADWQPVHPPKEHTGDPNSV